MGITKVIDQIPILNAICFGKSNSVRIEIVLWNTRDDNGADGKIYLEGLYVQICDKDTDFTYR